MNQTDYKGAIRKTIKRIGGSGLRIQYESGVRRRLDTAVRMNIIDGVKHVQQKAQEMIGEEIGADGVELTAHPYSAPDHEPVQGRQFSLDEFTKMQSGVSFADVDGNHYTGFKRPIAEWNCRHFAMYIILGISKRIYSNEQLAQWRKTNAAGFKLNGKHYTIYEASQKMREIETNIRRQKDIANAAKMMGDDQLRRQAQSTINSLQAEYNGFSKASGLAMRKDRAAVSKFRRVKTSAELKRNQLTNAIGSGIVKSLDIDDFQIMASTKNVSTEAVDVISAVIRKYEHTGGMYINDFYFGPLPSVDGGTPLLQIEPTADRTIRLNINTDIFSNTPLEEIDTMLASTKKNLANSLEEAVIHECGHAKSIYGKAIGEIEALYSELAEQHIEGVSTIAYKDGAECLAEIEILISRGADIPEEIMSFYNKYCGGKI